jgi:acyl-CoA thioesterase I
MRFQHQRPSKAGALLGALFIRHGQRTENARRNRARYPDRLEDEIEGAKSRAGQSLEKAASCIGKAALLGISVFVCVTMGANAAPLHIVAIGASNTHGWYVGNEGAYPAQLQALLRAQGIDAQVTNAGVPFDTTAMMLRRIDRDVPNGTYIAILQPGGNDLRFFGTKQQRAANIAEMERRLRARSINVIVYDEEIPLRYYAFDFIHLTREGHAMIASALFPRVIALDRHRSDVATGNASRR